MTPQSTFMILAPIERTRIQPIRDLLITMNAQLPDPKLLVNRGGVADPVNTLVPFGRLENLHFARFIVLDDQTADDINLLYGLNRPAPPVYLAFLGDFDGGYRDFIDQLIEQAGPGLRQIFSLCKDFTPETDLRKWMLEHEQKSAASYINWVGRTVKQTREEEKLRQALRAYLKESPELESQTPVKVHEALHAFVEKAKAEGRLTLTPAHPTPVSWTLHHIFDWITVAALLFGGGLLLVVMVASIVGVIPLIWLAWRLRSLEKSDKVFAPRPTREWEAGLASLEDHNVTNQFSVMGTLKPELFRRVLIRPILWTIGLAARTLYTKGRLARVYTIHSARWVYLENRNRLFFASNYDGSLESYMDDFINKVGFGLNLAFSNGVGYPRTRWLVLDGSKDEQTFKYDLRRHQLQTEVWYNAHAGLTATDLHRNSKIREGVETPSLTETEAREWVTLL